jgi:predicted membrane-bound spermidine synthase
MQTKQRHIFFLIFTLSGFSGLIYESIWTHYLKLFLGHAAYAQTLVLAIFMGGMALGSWLCSYYSVRWKNLLLVYAAAEGVIGLFALIFHPVFDRTIQLSYFSVIPRLGSPETITVFKWVLSSLLILPQTVLLGMTFPLMTGGMLRLEPQDPGKTVSMLYFANSIGAAIGVLASGFLLIRLFGLPGTIRAAGLINLILAVVVWQLLSKQKTEAPIVAMEGRSASGNESRGWRWLLAASLLTGAASFIYEIAWIRMLNFVLGSSTHAFELMLSAFIFGLAFGGLWIRRRIDHMAEPVRFLVGVQVVMGILAIATLSLYGSTFHLMQWLVQHLDKTDQGYLLFTLASHGIALAIMLPATFCAGMTLPLITYSLLRLGHGERSIGAVYASNTIGGILGVFFAIHLGMPLLGLKNLMVFGGCLDIVLGLALLWNVAPQAGRKATALATAGCVCIVIAALLFINLDPYKMASGVYRAGTLMTPTGSDIVFYKDGKTATVSVVKVQLMEATLMNIRTNGKADAAINVAHSGGASFDESTMSLLGVLPLAMNPGAKIARTSVSDQVLPRSRSGLA